jgi:hypothetical protein
MSNAKVRHRRRKRKARSWAFVVDIETWYAIRGLVSPWKVPA